MKKLLLIAALVITAAAVQAQDEEAPGGRGFQKEKLFIGGNFGLTFGNYTFINVSPQLGYRFTDFFAAGLGINGQYVSFRERNVWGDYKSSRGVVGLNTFARIYPLQVLMLQVQPEMNYIFGKEIYYNTSPRQEYKIDTRIVPSILMGGGAVVPSGRGALIVSVFYDVLQSDYSPYGRRPVYNIGYNIGL